MTNNPVENWINTDSNLKAILEEIDATGKPVEERAREAFFQLSEVYNLPKFPDDITEDDYALFEEKGIDNPRTVFEEVGIFRYLEPDEDPRGIVMVALYGIKNYKYTNIDECAVKHFGGKKKIPKAYMVYFTGESWDSRLHFLPHGESWYKPGVKCAMQIIRNS